MPRGKPNNGRNNQLPRFVSCALTEEDVEFLAKHILPAQELFDFVEKVLEAGLKLSCAYDAYNDATLVTVTRPVVAGKEEGLALSSRGPDLASALTASAYKLYQKLDGDLANAAAERPKNSWS